MPGWAKNAFMPAQPQARAMKAYSKNCGPPEAATLFHVGVSLVETLLRKGVVKRRPYKTE